MQALKFLSHDIKHKKQFEMKRQRRCAVARFDTNTLNDQEVILQLQLTISSTLNTFIPEWSHEKDNLIQVYIAVNNIRRKICSINFQKFFFVNSAVNYLLFPSFLEYYII